MKKICVVITARPSYSRVKSVLTAISNEPSLDLYLIVTASALLDRYGNVSLEIEKDGFTINSRVYTVLEGESPVVMAKTTGIAIVELTSELQRVKPDFVLTIADRYETIATAISATYIGIPLIHLQGGEITGSIDERVRHAITKLADYHLVSTANAASNVIRMGEDPRNVYVTGCPSLDIAKDALLDYSGTSHILDNIYGVGNLIDANKDFVIALLHPVTSEYQQSEFQANLLLEVLRDEGKQVLWFWPNVDAGSDGTSRALRRFREKNRLAPFFFIKNVNPKQFIALLNGAEYIVGNSSVAIRECSYLGVPALNIGSRQQYRERGPNVIDCDWDYHSITNSLKLLKEPAYRKKSDLYGDGNSGSKIAAIITDLCHSGIPCGKVLQFY